MREIKFRKWHKGLKDMTYWDGSENSNNLFWHTLTEYPEMYELMQYLNFKDDYGNYIYEGDVLERLGTFDNFNWSNPVDTRKRELIVAELKVKVDEFGHSTFCFSLNRQGTYSERTNPAKYKVIGNIYENPELLK